MPNTSAVVYAVIASNGCENLVLRSNIAPKEVTKEYRNGNFIFSFPAEAHVTVNSIQCCKLLADDECIEVHIPGTYAVRAVDPDQVP